MLSFLFLFTHERAHEVLADSPQSTYSFQT